MKANVKNTKANKVNNVVKNINLLKQAKANTKKLASVKTKVKEQSTFNSVVIQSNSILKTECFKLGYAIKLLLSNEETILTNRNVSDEFTQYDKIKLTAIFEIIKAAQKDSKLYNFLTDCKGIKSQKGKFNGFFLLRTVNKLETKLTNYINLDNKAKEVYNF